MPVVLTFDLSQPRPRELNRLRGAFERLGWERVGNTAHRYPALAEQEEVEDWFNRVVPVLMLLRAYSRFAVSEGRGMLRYTLDAQSSTGCRPGDEPVGSPPLGAGEIEYFLPSDAGRDFAERRLRDWIEPSNGLTRRRTKAGRDPT